MKIYIIDTNLLFSAIIKPESPFNYFFRSALPDDVELFAPSKLLLELEEKEARMALAGR